MSESTRSYALHRPIGPFTWPSEYHDMVSEIVNWDYMKYVPEIKRTAFGYIEWTELPPVEDLNRYELMVPEKHDGFLDKIGRILADLDRRGQYERLERSWDRARNQYGYTDDQIGSAMSRHMD